MEQKRCDKCGEDVAANKAFCPGCGAPQITEEKRIEQSGFERMDKTMQLGQTMYNQMLSEMGLNISKPSDAPEVVAKPPEASTAGGAVIQKDSRPSTGNINKWLITGGIVILLAALAIVAAAILLNLYLPRS